MRLLYEFSEEQQRKVNLHTTKEKETALTYSYLRLNTHTISILQFQKWKN